MLNIKLCFSLLFILFSTAGFSQEENSKTVYVWDFSDRSGKEDDLTASLTEEFEEAVLKSDCCKVLQRRTYSRLFDQLQNERAIMGLSNLPSSTVETLGAIEANTVIFGQIHDDSRSGQFKISVSFENFAGEIENSASVYMAKFDINNPKKREAAVSELIDELKLIPNPTVVETKVVDEWKFALTGCDRIGKNVKCGFTVTSQFRDRHFAIGAYSIAFDEYNYEYQDRQRQVANKPATGSRTATVTLIDGIQAHGFIVFENVSSRAKLFPRLDFRVAGDDLTEKYFQFRNVKIE